MAVHGHPDDESITTGGTLARCAAEGVTTCLVTCTDGRYGPVNPDLGLTLSPDDLASVRSAELHAAATALGVGQVRQLGYHDSGMTGSRENTAAQSFWSQPVDDVLGRVVEIIRSFRPHVVITYDPFGGTGHPDHIGAHRVTVLAVEAAAEEYAYAASGGPWVVRRLFYPLFPVSAMQSFIDASLRRGEPHPMGGASAEEVNYTRPDERVTHRVNIASVYACKRAGLMEHRTQVGRHYPQMYRSALARREHEHFRLAIRRLELEGWDDIFEPVSA